MEARKAEERKERQQEEDGEEGRKKRRLWLLTCAMKRTSVKMNAIFDILYRKKGEKLLINIHLK